MSVAAEAGKVWEFLRFPAVLCALFSIALKHPYYQVDSQPEALQVPGVLYDIEPGGWAASSYCTNSQIPQSDWHACEEQNI